MVELLITGSTIFGLSLVYRTISHQLHWAPVQVPVTRLAQAAAGSKKADRHMAATRASLGPTPHGGVLPRTYVVTFLVTGSERRAHNFLPC